MQYLLESWILLHINPSDWAEMCVIYTMCYNKIHPEYPFSRSPYVLFVTEKYRPRAQLCDVDHQGDMIMNRSIGISSSQRYTHSAVIYCLQLYRHVLVTFHIMHIHRNISQSSVDSFRSGVWVWLSMGVDSSDNRQRLISRWAGEQQIPSKTLHWLTIEDNISGVDVTGNLTTHIHSAADEQGKLTELTCMILWTIWRSPCTFGYCKNM
jgi:hypothetical protein